MLNKQQINSLFLYGLSLTQNHDDAEDLLQTTIEKLLSKAILPNTALAFARTVMRNQFIDHCRRKHIIDFQPIDADSPLLLDESDLEQLIIDREQIHKLMQQLGSAEREILFLWAIEGYTATEIANETAVPRGTVLARLYRIRQKLQNSVVWDDTERTVR